MKYIKPPLTVEQQIKLLSEQGLIIDDNAVAEHVLATVGYYRLSGYLLPFKEDHNSHGRRSFKPEITFSKVWSHYQFDRELRLLIMDAIEKIEVAFRAAITNVTSLKFDPFWYADKTYHRDVKPYNLLMRNIDKIIKDKHTIFIRHYLEKYDHPPYPPLWMIIETLSFGVCSKLFKNIKKVSIRKEIAAIFGQSTTILESWIQTLTFVRNICAHHARLWNQWLVSAPLIPKKSPLHNEMQSKNRHVIVVVYILTNLLKTIYPENLWLQKIYSLLEQYDEIINYQGMGFDSDWLNETIWQLTK